MLKFTIHDVRKLKPCYDPNKWLAEDWSGTIVDLLDDKRITFPDRLWVILRTDFVSEKLMRLFAVWCARQVQHLMKDERSLRALDVAEAFANGLTTKEELAAARAAAMDAARAAAWDAAGDAAMAAAMNAAGAAARDAARAAAKAAARAAARTAAGDAARAAAWDAARAAARAAARDAQEVQLRKMIMAGIETGDTKCT